MKKRKAFTIFEILITMLIMGTMSATVIPRIGDAKKEATETLNKINTNRSAACGVSGLEDFCDNNNSSNGNGNENGNENGNGNGYGYGYGTNTRYTIQHIGNDIKMCEYENCITIQDKNIGATRNGAGYDAPKASYGYYFQWGNNTQGYTYHDRDISEYGYGYGGVRVLKPVNAWGGANDQWNNFGYPINNPVQRKGPCPTGYHVPSIGEWNALIDMWKRNNYYTIITQQTSKFFTDFQIPVAGGLYDRYGGGFYGSSAMLWSSTPASFGFAYHINVEAYELNDWNRSESTANAYPVRCFKN